MDTTFYSWSFKLRNRGGCLSNHCVTLPHMSIMPGFVSENKKFQYLNSSDIYVLSSVHEGFGIVLQEAMQVGLPIVSTNYGGQVDIVKENENGILVKNRSATALAQGISRLISNRELMNRMRQNNIKKVKEFYADAIADAYINCIKRK